jgi:protein FRG1
MSTDKVRSAKLKFKGDKPKKKRKREDTGRHDNDNDDEKSLETWVFPENQVEIRGPTFIFHPSDPNPVSINFDTARNRIAIHPLPTEDAPPSILGRVPTDTAQVWVTTRVSGASTINLRTGVGEGKFLSCDAHGLVSSDREARGPQEEWTPVILPDGMVAFMNVYEKYLSVDEVAGGSLQLRGDSDEVGFPERFWVKVQNKYKKEATEEQKQKKLEEGVSGPTNIDEAGTKCVFILLISPIFCP